MQTAEEVSAWVLKHPLTPVEVDCATTVMLKILDGKCKMAGVEKRVMAWLYQAVKHQSGVLLGEDMHRLIADSERNLNDDMRNNIYEKRVLAETMISRPVMKTFKAMIRREGLLPEKTGVKVSAV